MSQKKLNLRNLKVSAKLRSGQIASFDSQLTLDGLLSYAWYMEHHPEMLLHGHDGEWPEADLPLKKIVPEHDANAWYWSVSFATFRVAKEYMYHWHRRFAMERERFIELGKKKTVDIKAGRMKIYRHPITVLVTPALTWYAVGDKDEVERMVDMVMWIGKNRSQGFGEIAEWVVEEVDHDWSVYGPDGRLMRNVPCLEEEAEGVGSIRPPHWLSQRWEPVKLWEFGGELG